MMKRHAKPTQFLPRLFLVATILFLSSASMSRLWAANSPFSTFTYDELSEATVAYDSSDKSAVDYDAGSVLTTGKKDDGTTGRRVSFAQFPKFLAAEGTTMFSRELGSTGPRATTELLDMMQAHGRTITTATEGSEALRFLDTMGAEASVGGPGHLSIILRENPSRAAAMEEFLHGTQDRLGIIDRLGVQGAENHVSDFMTRHSKLLGLEP